MNEREKTNIKKLKKTPDEPDKPFLLAFVFHNTGPAVKVVPVTFAFPDGVVFQPVCCGPLVDCGGIFCFAKLCYST